MNLEFIEIDIKNENHLKKALKIYKSNIEYFTLSGTEYILLDTVIDDFNKYQRIYKEKINFMD